MNSRLNEAQLRAVEYCTGPALVIAGAGSGKTRVITHKLTHLIQQGWNPNKLYALTFTNKAAQEMRERVEALLGTGISNSIQLGTFHSICARLLRLHAHHLGYASAFSIYDTSDSKALMRSCIKELRLDEKLYSIKGALQRISQAKGLLISPQAYASNKEIREYDNACHRPELYHLYLTYTRRCKENNAMDFDDLLYLMNVLLRDYPEVHQQIKDGVDYLLIDEYQDTNISQFHLARRLVEDHHRIFAVGDDAQSIYAFRGAQIANILNFQKQYPESKLFKLEQNYRSSKHIVQLANSLIEHNQERIPKELFTEQDAGELIPIYYHESSFEEASQVVEQIKVRREEGVALADQVIFYRTNAQSRLFEEVLRQEQIPYVIYGGTSFYARAEIKDIIAYLQMIVNPRNDIALLRTLGFPRKGIGSKTIEKIQTLARSQVPQLSLFETMTRILEHSLVLELGQGVRNKIASYVNLINQLAEGYKNHTKLSGWVAEILRDSGIIQALESEHTIEAEGRLENLKEFVSSAAIFELNDHADRSDPEEVLPLDIQTMIDFTQQIPLLTDQDNDEEQDAERVQLMTIHAAKGLEFPYVYITGVEEGLIPSTLVGEPTPIAQIEEERRLLYVAITRAKKHCSIHYCHYRMRNGQTQFFGPSRFLKELSPKHSYEVNPPQQNSYEADQHNNRTNYRNHRELNLPQHYNLQTNVDEGQPQLTSSYPSALDSPQTSILAQKETKSATEQRKAINHHEIMAGDRVQHAKFGLGIVLRIENSSLGEKASVSFDDGVQREVILKYARLEKL